MKHLIVVLTFIVCLFSANTVTSARILFKSKNPAQTPVIQEAENQVEVSNISESENELQPTEENICVNPHMLTAKVQKVKNKPGYAIYVGNKQAIWIMKDLQSISAKDRANVIANNLNKILESGINPATIKPVKIGNNTFIQAGNTKIATVDTLNAKAVGVSVHELAYTWANGTRVALGANALRKDYTDISRGFTGRNSRYIGHKTVGMASWYGPKFHGRRSADGSRYNKEEYTAAHRTYPFGTLVKVTNLRTSRSCVVKITDRGPYAHGRVIDLSKKAAEDIGILATGVGKVKLEVVGQY